MGEDIVGCRNPFFIKSMFLSASLFSPETPMGYGTINHNPRF